MVDSHRVFVLPYLDLARLFSLVLLEPGPLDFITMTEPIQATTELHAGDSSVRQVIVLGQLQNPLAEPYAKKTLVFAKEGDELLESIGNYLHNTKGRDFYSWFYFTPDACNYLAYGPGSGRAQSAVNAGDILTGLLAYSRKEQWLPKKTVTIAQLICTFCRNNVNFFDPNWFLLDSRDYEQSLYWFIETVLMDPRNSGLVKTFPLGNTLEPVAFAYISNPNGEYSSVLEQVLAKKTKLHILMRRISREQLVYEFYSASSLDPLAKAIKTKFYSGTKSQSFRHGQQLIVSGVTFKPHDLLPVVKKVGF